MAGLAILMFHRVAVARDPMRGRMSTVAEFRSQMTVLRRLFRPTGLSDGLRRLQAGDLPARSVAVTFDDGYADNVNLALPVLQELGVPAAFFIATGYLGGGRMWNDTVIESVRRLTPGRYRLPQIGPEPFVLDSDATRRPLAMDLLRSIKHLAPALRAEAADALEEMAGGGLPTDLMMRRTDVRRLLDAGMEVGGHTRSHPILSSLGDGEAEEEIRGGLDDLRGLLGREITLFAYPNGQRNEDYGDREVALLERSGVEFALATNRGVATSRSHRLQLPRLSPLHRTPAKFAYALWRAYREPEWDWRSVANR